MSNQSIPDLKDIDEWDERKCLVYLTHVADTVPQFAVDVRNFRQDLQVACQEARKFHVLHSRFNAG